MILISERRIKFECDHIVFVVAVVANAITVRPPPLLPPHPVVSPSRHYDGTKVTNPAVVDGEWFG